MSEPMPESPPEPVPVPVPEAHSPLAHVRAWFEKDVFPEIADIRIRTANADLKAEQALSWLKAHAANAKDLAEFVQEAVKVIDPADDAAAAGLIAKAGEIAVEAARIAEEVLAFGT